MTTVNKSIAAGGDDGYWYGTQFDNSSYSNYMGKLSTLAAKAFYRFLNIDANGTANSGSMSFKASSNQTNTVPLRIYGVKEANPTAPTSASDGNGRTLTTAYVSWTPGNWTSGQWYATPDLSTIIQELLDTYTYTGTQAMLFLVVDDGAASNTNRQSRTYDYAYPPTLTFDYTSSNDPPTIALNTADQTEFSTTKPTVEFTGNDTESDDLTYEVQIADNDSFLDGSQIATEFDPVGGSGTTIHPNPDTTESTTDSHIAVDETVMQAFQAQGELDSVEFYFGLHESNPEDVDGTYLVRIYEATGESIDPVPDPWQASHAYAQGDMVIPTSQSNQDQHFVYRCTTAGTSDSTEPTWPGAAGEWTDVTEGGTTNDNTVVWETVWTLHPINPRASDDPVPQAGWIAQSETYPYNQSYGGSSWKTCYFTGAQKIRLEPGKWYMANLVWWPNDRVYTNAITIPTRNYEYATHPGNGYLDALGVSNHGPRVICDALFRVNVTNSLLYVASDTDAGFTNTAYPPDTDPFTAGDKISFTVQVGDELLPNITQFWRARVSDPSGSGLWSDWATERTFTIVESISDPIGLITGAPGTLISFIRGAPSIPIGLKTDPAGTLFDFTVGITSSTILKIIGNDVLLPFTVGAAPLQIGLISDTDTILGLTVGPAPIVINKIVAPEGILHPLSYGFGFLRIDKIVGQPGTLHSFIVGVPNLLSKIIGSPGVIPNFNVGTAPKLLNKIVESNGVLLDFSIGWSAPPLNTIIGNPGILLGFIVVETRHVILIDVYYETEPTMEVEVE